jgi:crotonobetainyl-CoA:carnitine CoA-transferase CaiB-like acyl-CoA transferase
MGYTDSPCTMRQQMENGGILQGIHVVDMTSVIFGPYCTATLADMGADVIKLEPARGDEVRRVGIPAVSRGMGPGHMTFNRGKRSITWDLKTPAGKAALKRLVARSQVFIHNLRSEAIERLGLNYANVKALRSDIVYVHCSGFGSGGKYEGQAAYDDIIQAASGAASLLSLADGNPAPRYLPMAMADKVSGLHAVYAVLAALFHRERTGEGQFVEVPMFESFAHFLLQDHLYGRTFVPPNAPIGYPRQLDPLRHPLRTQDGYVAIAPYTDERWVRFFEVTGHAQFLAEHALETPRLRFAALEQMQTQMARIVLDHTTDYWLALMARHDIPVSAVRRLDEVLEDPHLASVGFFQTRRHPTEGDYLQMQPPVRFGSGGSPTVRMPPLLGEHNDEVLDQLDAAGQE